MDVGKDRRKKRKEKKGKRLFGAVMLALMAVLTVATVAFATSMERSNDTYSLIIKKLFAEDTPEEVKEQAQDQTYTFKITGTRKTQKNIDGEDKWVDIKVDETITLPRKVNGDEDPWESNKLVSDGPFNVTVTELTDNITIQDSQGNYYNMSGSSSDTNIRVNSRKHEVKLRNNSTLNIARPDDSGDPETLWYRITNRPYDEHEVSSNFEKVDKVFSLKIGEDPKKLEGLCAAIYTIEQIVAPDGYQLQMGERTETVKSGEGHFNINGTPGQLTLTAGGTKGDGAVHYYTIDRMETDEGDTSEFVTRRVSINSGEECISDNLPRGGYTIKEYTIKAGPSIVITPETAERIKTKSSSALTSGTQNSWKYIDLSYPEEDFDVDYIKMVSFGPLYNDAGNRLSSSHTYTTFRYGLYADNGKLYTKDIISYSNKNGFSGYTCWSTSDAVKLPVSSSKKIGFTVTGLKSSTAKKIGVSWTEYDEKETKTKLEAGVEGSITVDDRKWIKIEAPALNDPNAPGADQIVYYYTIKDKDGNLIQGTTDKANTTVKLLPGTNTEMMLPAAGSYTIVESIAGSTPVGFTMKVAGNPFGTTEADKPIDVQVGGERTVTISKPALNNPPGGSKDERDYIFNVTGNGFSETIRVKAGESKTVTLPKEGKYTITPQKDVLEAYKLNYTDSGAIYGTASGSTGTITFTNSFSSGKYGYRYVHEYYIREPDGTYTYEGNSQITTRLGRKGGEKYQALDISQAPDYEQKHYEHFDEAYGWVDPIPSAVSTQSELEKETLMDATSEENEEEETEEPTANKDTKPSEEETSEVETFEEETEGPTGSGEAEPSGAEKESSGAETSEEETSEAETSEEETSEAETSEEETEEPTGSGEAEPSVSEKETSGAKTSEEEAESPMISAGKEPSKKEITGSTDIYDPEDDDTHTQEGDRQIIGRYYQAFSINQALHISPALNISLALDIRQAIGPKGGSYEHFRKPNDVSSVIMTTSGSQPDPDERFQTGSTSNEETEPFGEETMEGEIEPSREETTKEERTEPISNEESGASEEETIEDSTEAASSEEPTFSEEETKEDSTGPTTNGETEPSEEEIEGFANSEEIEISEEGTIEKETEDPTNSEEPVLSDDASSSDARMRSGDLGPAMFYNGWDDISTDDNGIIDKGTGLDSEERFLSYGPDPSKDYIDVTEDASQIVILRYYRERQPKGKYNVIHVYYFRDENGDRWEGTSGVRPQDGELGVKYTGDKVKKEYDFKPVDAERSYTYTWDGRPQYGVIEDTGGTGNYDPEGTGFAGNGKIYRPNNAWTAVEGTKEGDQIIILRYYRELDREGCYQVVHEYYSREANESLNDGADSLPDSAEGDSGPSEDSSEVEGDVQSPEDVFAGTLNRDDGYVYTFIGKTDMERINAPLSSRHTEDNVTRKPSYLNVPYQYIDSGYGITDIGRNNYTCNPDMQWASSTENGNEVIILRYYRDGSTPDEPDVPGPTPPGGGGGGGGDPDPTPPSTTAPDPTSEQPTETIGENPGYPTELPDPNDPNSPDRITIWEDGVPKTYVKVWNPETGTWEYILEEEVPLSWQDLPKTGDKSRNVLWMVLFISSIIGIIWLIAVRRKERS